MPVRRWCEKQNFLWVPWMFNVDTSLTAVSQSLLPFPLSSPSLLCSQNSLLEEAGLLTGFQPDISLYWFVYDRPSTAQLPVFTASWLWSLWSSSQKLYVGDPNPHPGSALPVICCAANSMFASQASVSFHFWRITLFNFWEFGDMFSIILTMYQVHSTSTLHSQHFTPS